MLRRAIITVMIMEVLVTVNIGRCERNYTHVLTVGEGPGYDYDTINDAIQAMKQMDPPLGPSTLGCIKVYPGTYEHCAGRYWISDDTKWLPSYCDLTGMGNNIDDVVIKQPAGTPINSHTIIGAGDNYISHLKVYNIYGTQNGIYLLDNSTLTDCIVNTIHQSVWGHENFVVTDCKIWGMFGDCIRAEGTFTISDCELYPRARSFSMEAPAGIYAYGTGTIRDVNISASCASSYPYGGGALLGIVLRLTEDEQVLISNVEIDLQLTSIYNPDETEALRVCGILSGTRAYDPSSDYKGRAVVRDCTISVTGIEDDSDPAGDGAGIMVDGICVRGGGTVKIYGDTSITTSRTPAGNAQDGYEYLLNNENGTLGVNFNTVVFDPNGDGEPDCYDPDYTNGDIDELWEFCIKNNLGKGVAWFDNLGDLFLKGTLTQNVQPLNEIEDHDEFRVQDSDGYDVAIIDATNGNMRIKGELHQEQDMSQLSPEGFIIKNSNDEIVAYIDDSGDDSGEVYLTGKLYQNPNP